MARTPDKRQPPIRAKPDAADGADLRCAASGGTRCAVAGSSSIRSHRRALLHRWTWRRPPASVSTARAARTPHAMRTIRSRCRPVGLGPLLGPVGAHGDPHRGGQPGPEQPSPELDQRGASLDVRLPSELLRHGPPDTRGHQLWPRIPFDAADFRPRGEVLSSFRLWGRHRCGPRRAPTRRSYARWCTRRCSCRRDSRRSP